MPAAMPEIPVSRAWSPVTSPHLLLWVETI
jgi:hypothetical protein